MPFVARKSKSIACTGHVFAASNTLRDKNADQIVAQVILRRIRKSTAVIMKIVFSYMQVLHVIFPCHELKLLNREVPLVQTEIGCISE